VRLDALDRLIEQRGQIACVRRLAALADREDARLLM
jgi:hypothetical protein